MDNPELFISGTVGITLLISCVITVVAIVGSFILFRFIMKKVGPDQAVLKQGIPAQARILSVQQTGVMVNDQPQVAFQLEIHPPVGTPYQASLKAVIPLVHIPQYQPGASVPVKIHPSDRNRIAFAV